MKTKLPQNPALRSCARLPHALSICMLAVSMLSVQQVQAAELPVDQKAAVKKTSLHEKRAIKGLVLDATTKEPLIGASVRVLKSTTGVITDSEGRFTLDVTSGDQLVIDYIGYNSRTIETGDLALITIEMEPANETLDEVVVVGAGTQKKVSLTGAISSLSGDLLKSPSSSLTTSFAGKLAGVISMTNSGRPGSSSEFYIRGVGTFGGRATPLILLDDVEISADDLNNIPAESIKSFSILKDASATAIYGVRGANGVMLITTKEGMENSRAVVNVTLESSLQQPTKFPEFVDGATWMEIYNEAQQARTPGAIPAYSDETIAYTRQGINPYVYPDVNWRDLLFDDHNFNQRANINIQGGGSKVTYYMGLQVNHDTGILNTPKNYYYDTNVQNWGYTFQNNIAYKVTKSTKIDLRMNAQIRNQKGPEGNINDIFYQMYSENPVTFPATFPAQPGDTHIRFGNAILSGEDLRTNPYAYMLRGFEELNYNTLNTSLRLTQNLDMLTEGLELSALVNWKNYSSQSYIQRVTPYYYRVVDGSWGGVDAPDQFATEMVGNPGTDYITQTDPVKNGDQTFYFDARINYNRTFSKHSVSGLLMYMQREFRTAALPQRNQGLSGRFTYDFDRRYFAEFNFGYNGTERLAKEHRFEFFPAMSLGYVPSNESWWEPISDVVDYFKLRGSLGLVGSDETGLQAGAEHFLFFDTVILNGGGVYVTGPSSDMAYSKQGPAVNGYAVANATWERVRKLDIGVDFQLFNQVNVTFDWYKEHRYNILMKRGAWPKMMGYWNGVPWSNIGEVDNHGFELSVDWRKELMKDLVVDFRGSFTYAQNKYVNVDEPVYPYVWQTQTGKPLSRQTGYIAEGLFESQEEIDHSAVQNLGGTVMPGDIKYRDVDGNGIINENDKVMISPYGTQPRIQYGFGMSLTYRNWDFGVFFNGSAKRTLMISGITPFGQNNHNLMRFIAEDYWSESNPNPNAAYPRLGVTDNQVNNNMQPSSYWMRNGNFLRFKTLELGYTIKFARIYFSGDNLAVWSPFKLWDPELAWNAYPLSRTFNIGAQFKF